MPTNTKAKQNPTIGSSAQGLADMGFTAAQIAGAVRAYVTPRGGALSYWTDGTTPTATYGHTFPEGITTEIEKEIAGLEVIRESADVTLTIELETYV